LRNTPDSGKIALTVPSALWLFSYAQHAEDRRRFQAFPPLSPVSVAVPLIATLYQQIGHVIRAGGLVGKKIKITPLRPNER